MGGGERALPEDRLGKRGEGEGEGRGTTQGRDKTRKTVSNGGRILL